MEPSKFDELTKAIVTATSRRQALKAIAATLGGLLGLGGVGTALANCKPNGIGCNTNSQCCSGGCCHGTCTNLGTTSNCGTCGHACGSEQVCQNGQCVTQCAPAPACKSDCPCPEGQVCQNGVCILSCLQQPCTSDSDCCSGACTATFCGSGGIGVCCGTGGTYCASDSDCCCGAPCDLTTNTCGCFTAGTLIAMADGTSRPIEHIQVGDLVLGNAGQVNRVTEVLLPVLGHRPLYSLNGSNFFVTSGHPFMTEEGWKAIDPTAVPTQLSKLHVDRLSVGDRLLTLTAAAVPVGAGRAISAESVDVRIDGVVLHSLISQFADPATQLYNLRLDGDHTYFANDLLVHNK